MNYISYIHNYFPAIELMITTPPIYTNFLLEQVNIAWNKINEACKKDYQNHKFFTIKDAIQQYALYIKNNQKRMLNSLLNRFKESISVDRIMVEDQKENLSLVTDLDQIKSLAPKQYADLQKKRLHSFDILPSE